MALVLADADQLDVEKECSVGWNVRWSAHRPIGQVTGNRELPFATDFHGHQAFIPTLDHPADADRKLGGWLAGRAVKLGAVFERAPVVDNNSLPYFRTWPITNF